MASDSSPAPTASLRARWEALREAQPGIRARDAAERLGVSEAELAQAAVGETMVRLEGDPGAMIEALGTLGRVMALTRNASIVHERWGTYEEIHANAMHVLVLGPDIDLRIFPRQWRHAYAYDSGPSARRRMRGLQFFDAAGVAVHKVYLGDTSDLDAYAALVNAFRAPVQDVPVVAEAPPGPPEGRRPDDVDAFLEGWASMTDTHDFFGLLHEHRTDRLPALECALGRFVREVSADVFETLLRRASDERQELMVFVGNRGCIQIHTGPVQRIVNLPKAPAPVEWLNVLDPDFNLHARAPDVARAFVVTKPTEDGDVTSVELYDEAGRTLAQIFGPRKPGIPEQPSWRRLVAGLA
ncbi:MAG: ChuX/HutX family heme-like substrate-binding protein [Myxococcota bacterium]